jgi:hypothetical protein
MTDALSNIGENVCYGWRCLICGRITDPTIEANKKSSPVPNTELAPKNRARYSTKVAEVDVKKETKDIVDFDWGN